MQTSLLTFASLSYKRIQEKKIKKNGKEKLQTITLFAPCNPNFPSLVSSFPSPHKHFCVRYFHKRKKKNWRSKQRKKKRKCVRNVQITTAQSLAIFAAWAFFWGLSARTRVTFSCKWWRQDPPIQNLGSQWRHLYEGRNAHCKRSLQRKAKGEWWRGEWG